MVAQAGQALAWPVSDDAGIPTPVWAITNERRNSVIAFLLSSETFAMSPQMIQKLPAITLLEGMFPELSTNQLKVCVFTQWVFLTTPLLRTVGFLPKRYEPT